MRQAATVLKLVSSDGDRPSSGEEIGARDGDKQETGGAGAAPADASVLHGMLHSEGEATAHNARHDLLEACVEAHTRVSRLWLDRLLEEGDGDERISMIHRQQAWLSMLQSRLARD